MAGEIAQELQVLSQVEEALSGTGVPKPRIDTTVQTLLDGERVNPTVAVTEDVVGTSPDPVNLFLPGVITMFVLFGLTIGAATLVQERKRGTLERLLTTRLGVGQLFMGKFLANISRGFIQTLILLALSYAVFQIFTPLSFVEALVIALIFSATASSVGMVIASVARTEDQAIWIAVFFTMSMAMLRGTFFEISEGTVFDTISKASINTYANDAFRVLIVEGGSLADAAMELAVLVGVAIVGLVISRALFKVMAGGR